MRTSRNGYLMAMLAGLAIVGASTGGVVAGTSHHDRNVASAASAAASVSETPAPVSAAATTSTSATPAAATRQPTVSPPATGPARSGPVPSSGPSSQAATPTTAASTAVPATPTKASATPTATKTPAPASSTAAAAKLKFKDGQYTATGSYNSPGGVEKLGVTLTLSADKVTKSVLDLQGGAGLSHSFQSAFETGYSSQVIGKDIGSISLGAVSGSSLTGLGFNDALKQIETKARQP